MAYKFADTQPFQTEPYQFTAEQISQANGPTNGLYTNGFILDQTSGLTAVGSLNEKPSEVLNLSDTMSELAIADCAQPPPNKIRRRNAITIQDPEYQLHESGGIIPPQQHGAFESSVLLQRVEELQRRLGTSYLGDMSSEFKDNFDYISPPPPSPVQMSEDCYDLPDGPVKRKVPNKSSREKEIRSISLHEDLKSFEPRGEFNLPEIILRRYRSNPCSAVVLYQPPEDILSKLRSSQNNNIDRQEDEDKDKDEQIIEDEMLEVEMSE